MFEKVETDKHGLNVKIQSNIRPDAKMREIGFTDYAKNRWCYSRLVQFPKEKQYEGVEISFDVTIPKDGSRLRIDVLDEDFCQPYDYQLMLTKNPEFEPALIVRDFVEEQMAYLQEQGVLSGHVKGEYI